eukprot:PhM_4_TR11642/c2_g3_i1/m.68231
MASAVVDLITALIRVMFNVVVDLLCIVAFIVGFFGGVWRLPWNIAVIAHQKPTKHWDYRAVCVMILGMFLLDVITLPALVIVVVTMWRVPHLSRSIQEHSGRRGGMHDYGAENRARVLHQAALFFVDIPFILMTVLLHVIMPWRIPKFWRRLKSKIGDSWLETNVRSFIFFEFVKGFLDVLSIPMAAVIVLTVYRVAPLAQEWKDIDRASGDGEELLLKKKLAFARHFALVFVDIPFGLMLLVIAVLPWRLRYTVSRLRVSRADAWKCRAEILENFARLLADICFVFPMLSIVIVSLYRLPTLCMRLSEAVQPWADDKPLLSLISVHATYLPRGLEFRCVAASTPSTTASIVRDKPIRVYVRNDGLWECVAKTFGGAVAFGGKMMLPLSIKPKYFDVEKFVAAAANPTDGGTFTFSVVFDVDVSQSTLKTNIQRLSDVYDKNGGTARVDVQVEYGKHEGTLFNMSFSLKELERVLTTVQNSGGDIFSDSLPAIGSLPMPCNTAGRYLCDVAPKVVLLSFGQVMLDLVALLCFVLLHLIPHRCFAMYKNVCCVPQTSASDAAIEKERRTARRALTVLRAGRSGARPHAIVGMLDDAEAQLMDNRFFISSGMRWSWSWYEAREIQALPFFSEYLQTTAMSARRLLELGCVDEGTALLEVLCRDGSIVKSHAALIERQFDLQDDTSKKRKKGGGSAISQLCDMFRSWEYWTFLRKARLAYLDVVKQTLVAVETQMRKHGVAEQADQEQQQQQVGCEDDDDGVAAQSTEVFDLDGEKGGVGGSGGATPVPLDPETPPPTTKSRGTLSRALNMARVVIKEVAKRAAAPNDVDDDNGVLLLSADDITQQYDAIARGLAENDDLANRAVQLIRDREAMRKSDTRSSPTRRLPWSDSRLVILSEVKELMYDLVAVLCFLLTAATVYRTYSVVSSVFSRDSAGCRRRECLRCAAEIGMDVMYVFKFILIVLSLRHAVSCVVDIMQFTSQFPSFKSARIVIDVYFRNVLADVMVMLSFIFAWRAIKYTVAAATFGFFSPGILMDNMLTVGESSKCRAITILVLICGALYGYPFVATYALMPPAASSDNTTAALSVFFVGFGLIFLTALFAGFRVCERSARDDGDKAGSSFTAVRSLNVRYLTIRPYTVVQMLSLAFEVLTLCSLVVIVVYHGDVAERSGPVSTVSTVARYLLLSVEGGSAPLNVGTYVAIALALLLYVIASIPIVAFDVFDMRGGHACVARWHLWHLGMQSLRHTLAPFILYNLFLVLNHDNLVTGTSSSAAVICTMLLLVFCVPCCFMMAGKFHETSFAVLEVQYSKFYALVTNASVVIITATSALGANTEPKACLAVIAAFSLIQLVLTVFTWGERYRACSVRSFALWRGCGYLVIAIFAIIGLAYSNNKDSEVPFLVALGVGCFLGVAASVYQRTRRSPLDDDVHALQTKLVDFEASLTRSGKMLSMWRSGRRAKAWRRNVAGSVRVCELADLVLQLDNSISIRGRHSIFLATRLSWIMKMLRLRYPLPEKTDFERELLGLADSAWEIYCDCMCSSYNLQLPSDDLEEYLDAAGLADEATRLKDLDELAQALINGSIL